MELIAWEKGGIFARDKADAVNISPKEVTGDSKESAPKKPKLNPSAPDAFILDSNTAGVIAMFRSCARIEGRGLDLQLVDATGAALIRALGGRSPGLSGKHQYGNATLAIRLCQAVLLDTKIQIDHPKTLEGIQSAQWPARCQVLERGPWTYLLDGAHTFDSMTATVGFFCEQVKEQDCILIFNCSHERNPIELLRLLLPLSISKVYFAKSDSAKPSPLDVPTAKALLEEQGLPVKTNLLEQNEKPTWQETLASVWDHLTDDKEKSTRPSCNLNARMVLEDLSKNHRPAKVLVTGSLYLVGSFLTALEWNEESSPDIDLS